MPIGPDPPELRGAGGLRIPGLDGRPGPEATVFWFAFQLGVRLTAIGQYYESINEFVMPAVTMPHLHDGAWTLPSMKRSRSYYLDSRQLPDSEVRLLPTPASGAIIVTNLSHEGGAA